VFGDGGVCIPCIFNLDGKWKTVRSNEQAVQTREQESNRAPAESAFKCIRKVYCYARMQNHE
jgi:hypothetical protein